MAAVFLAVRRTRLPQREELGPLLVTMPGAVLGWPILLALALERTTSAHVSLQFWLAALAVIAADVVATRPAGRGRRAGAVTVVQPDRERRV